MAFEAAHNVTTKLINLKVYLVMNNFLHNAERVPASRFRREINKWLRTIEDTPVLITLNGQDKAYFVGPNYWNSIQWTM